MAQVQYDAVLLEDSIPATSAPKASQISCCRDASGAAVVFSLSRSEVPELLAIFPDGNSRSLNSLLPFDATQSRLQAFGTLQRSDSKVFLVVAAEMLRSSDKSRVVFIDPFDLVTLRKETVEKLKGRETECETVYRINLTSSPETTYPSVIAIHKADRAVFGKDLTRFIVNKNNVIARSSSVEVPENAEDIIDFTQVSYDLLGSGVAILYRVLNDPKPRLINVLTRPDTKIPGRLNMSRIRWECPPDPTCISTFETPSGYTDVIVGTATGITHFTANQSVDDGARGTNYPVMANSKQLLTAHSGDELSIWSINKTGVVSYMRSKVDTPCAGTPVDILPTGHASCFIPLLSISASHNEVWQTLVLSNKDGDISLLEQASDTGIWHDRPFFVATDDDLVDMKCWAISIAANSDAGEPATKIALLASSNVEAYFHGKAVTLRPAEETVLDLDADGKMVLTIPTQDLAAQIITVTKVIGSDDTTLALSGAVAINPAAKSHGVIESMTLDDMKNLYPDAAKIPSQRDLELAHKNLSKISKVASSLPSDGSSMSRNTNWLKCSTWNSKPVTGSSWEWWEWYRRTVDNVKELGIQMIEGVWTIVIEIGKKIWTFALDCIDKVGAAFSAVFDSIGLALGDLWNKLAALLSWDDIIQTKNTISDFLSAGLDYGLDNIDGLAVKVDNAFDKMKAEVADALRNNALKRASETMGGQPGLSGQAEYAVREAPKPSMDAQFQLMSKNISNSLKDAGTNNSNGEDRPTKYRREVQKLYEDEIFACSEKFRIHFENAGKNIIPAIKKAVTGAKTSEILDTLIGNGDILYGCIEALRGLALALLNLISRPLRWLLNKETEGPEDKLVTPNPSDLFSRIGPWLKAIYKKFGGREFSFIDFVSLLIAIPTTLSSKLFGNGAPPTFEGPKDMLRNEYLKTVLFGAKPKGGTTPVTVPEAVSEAGKRNLAVITGAAMVGGKYLKYEIIKLYTLRTLVSKGVGGVVSSAPSILRQIASIVEVVQFLLTAPKDSSPYGPYNDILKMISLLSATRAASHLVLAWSGLYNLPGNEKIFGSVDCSFAVLIYFLSQAENVRVLATGGDKSSTALTMASAHYNYMSAVGTFLINYFHDTVPQIAAVGILGQQQGNAIVMGATGGLFALKIQDRSKYVHTL